MKRIFITEEEKAKLVQEFSDSLKLGMYDGAFTFTRNFQFTEKEHCRATLIYTPDAFAKTIMLLARFDSEVAWHALVRRGEMPGEFIIFDVIVYPQKVTGSTVNTDDEGYAQFMIDITDEEAKYMHAQCHSHVNMAVSPSTVDKTHQEKVLQCMNGQGFYVFQIWNKRLESNSFIYDFDNNVMYETKDIDIEVIDNQGYFLADFIDDAKKIVKQTTSYGTSYSSGYTNGGYSYGQSSYTQPASQPTKSETREERRLRRKKASKDKRLLIDEDLYWDEEISAYTDEWGRPYR